MRETASRATGLPIRVVSGALVVVFAVLVGALTGCGGDDTAGTPASNETPAPRIVGMYVGATPARFDAAAYVVIEQLGGDDEIVAVSAVGIDSVSTMGAGVEMGSGAPVAPSGPAGFPVALPSGSRVAFSPGGDHLMLAGLERDLTPGDVVRVTFDFARHPDVVVDALVVQPADLLEIAIFREDAT